MDVAEFRSKIKPNVKLSVADHNLVVKEVVRFRFDDGSFYIKCFLSDSYVLADDLTENMFVLVKEISTSFQPPFPPELDFDGKKFKFLYTAHAVAEEVSGEEIFKLGDGERFWDYQAADGSYLSLGINDSTQAKLDFYGQIIANDSLSLE